MKIFLVKPVAKKGNWVFRDIVSARADDPEELWTFKGTLKRDEWMRAQPAVKLLGGKRKGLGDFLGCTPGSAFAIVDLVGTEVSRILERCGELLPVSSPVEAPISIVNIVPLVDAGRRIDEISPSAWSERFEFDASLVPPRSLFKINQHSWHIFASEGVVPKRDDFKAAVERNGYTGLEFREVWNDDGDPVETLEFAREILRTTPGLAQPRRS